MNDAPNTVIKKAPIIFIAIIGAFLATLNQTIMSVAVPELIHDFNITAATAQWLTTGYMLVNGVLIPITAFLMNRFSTRQLFQGSMMIFLVGTLISALAVNFPALLIGRLIQAAGAGILMPFLTNVVLILFPPEKRGSAMGIVGLAVVFAPAIGPAFAGYMIENYSWQSMFYWMLPFTVVVIVCAYIYLKNVSEPKETKLDSFSFILSSAGFGLVLYGFSRAGSIGWSSIEVIITLILGFIALTLFTTRQLHSKDAFLDLRVFKFNMFTLTTLINVAVTMVMYADMMLLPLYLQNARGFTALESGLLLLPGALIMGLLMPVSGRLFDKFGAKWLCIIGMFIIILTTFGFVNLKESTSFISLILFSTGRRVGIALLMMPVQTAGLNQLPKQLYAHGTAISNTVRQVAGAVGTSLLVTVMSSRSKSHLNEWMASRTAVDVHGQKHIQLMATIEGINDAYVVIIAISILGLILSFFLKKSLQPKGTLIENEQI